MNVFPDPGIEHGSFRVLPRTDGGHVVVDVRRKPGKQTVGGKFKTAQEAGDAALTWHLQGHG